jgi:hypothetical protein
MEEIGIFFYKENVGNVSSVLHKSEQNNIYIKKNKKLTLNIGGCGIFYFNSRSSLSLSLSLVVS